MSNKLKFDSKTNPDDFKAISPIGFGGFGQVIELVHIPTGIHFAGKIIRKSHHVHNKKIKNEISIMKSMKCKNIVHYYGLIQFPKENPHKIVIMDYCDLGSLRDILKLKKQNLNEDQISIVLHDILKALSSLHNKYHIVHGDIKAGNVLMSSDGKIKLTDFGLSHKLGNFDCIDSSFDGSPYWMAPEIILCENYSFPADIWSVGATAVELIEGEPPFSQFPPSQAMNEIISLGFPGFGPDIKISKDFDDFVKKCFKMRPNQRPTADELLKHPFIKRSKKLNRIKVFGDLLKKEARTNDWIQSENFKDLQEYIHFEDVPDPKLNNINDKEDSSINNDQLVKKEDSLINDKQLVKKEDPTMNNEQLVEC